MQPRENVLTWLEGMALAAYRRVASFKTVADFRQYLETLGVEIPVDDEVLPAPASPLAQPFQLAHRTVGNRFCVQPMEGWDGTADGRPTELVKRRWRRFGESGAKLVWGGEAVAVRHDGRANPNQLVASPENKGALAELRQVLVDAHAERFGGTGDLIVGLQLTHSGRFCRPNPGGKLEPRIAYHHPVLDAKFGIDPDDGKVVFSDAEVEDLIADYVAAARLAWDAGFDFVDIKHCHGYLLHEFLSAYTRPGKYGGDFEGRTRILREIVRGIRRECPHLLIGVRLSAFDFVPFQPEDGLAGARLGKGVPVPHAHLLPYRYGFGLNPDQPVEALLEEPKAFLSLLKELGVVAVNLSAGSPYYNPHIQRPALFPPSDGYAPPEDPLVGVARQMQAVRELKAAFPDLPMVGSAYSYLQDYLPHVAQAAVRHGWTDFVGLGRMMLSYPHLPADVLAGRPLQRTLICRTFSDCTTAPRNGMVSGCFPLDPFYKGRPEWEKLRELKREGKAGSAGAGDASG